MFRLMSIQTSIGKSTLNPSGTSIRCTILADNTTDELPVTTDNIEDCQDGIGVAPGSVAITPAGSIAIMDNSGEWGTWL